MIERDAIAAAAVTGEARDDRLGLHALVRIGTDREDTTRVRGERGYPSERSVCELNFPSTTNRSVGPGSATRQGALVATALDAGGGGSGGVTLAEPAGSETADDACGAALGPQLTSA